MKKISRIVIMALAIVMTVVSMGILNTSEVQAAKKPKLNNTSVKIRVGETFQLKVLNNKGKVKWRVTHGKKNISLNNGLVTGLNRGSATVLASPGKNTTFTAHITVMDAFVAKDAKEHTYFECEYHKAEQQPEIGDVNAKDGVEIKITSDYKLPFIATVDIDFLDYNGNTIATPFKKECAIIPGRVNKIELSKLNYFDSVKCTISYVNGSYKYEDVTEDVKKSIECEKTVNPYTNDRNCFVKLITDNKTYVDINIKENIYDKITGKFVRENDWEKTHVIFTKKSQKYQHSIWTSVYWDEETNEVHETYGEIEIEVIGAIRLK